MILWTNFFDVLSPLENLRKDHDIVHDSFPKVCYTVERNKDCHNDFGNDFQSPPDVPIIHEAIHGVQKTNALKANLTSLYLLWAEAFT
eukprot:5175708-Amphidinium_carterae.1